MSVDELAFEERLRTTLEAWAQEAPLPSAVWEPAAPRRRWSNPGFVLTRVAPVAAAMAVIVAVLTWPAPPDTATQRVEVVSRPDLVEADIPVGTTPGVRVIAAGERAVFVASENDRRLFRIDPATNRVTASVALAAPDVVAVGDGAVFAVIEDRKSVV